MSRDVSRCIVELVRGSLVPEMQQQQQEASLPRFFAANVLAAISGEGMGGGLPSRMFDM